jgi:hypothetical protein
MSLSYKELLLTLIVVFNVIFCAFLVWKTPKGKGNRTKFLWKLVLLNGLVFSLGLVIIVVILPQPTLSIISGVVYDFLISYVLCVEIPAYLKLSKYDENLGNILKDLRGDLVKMRFSFDTSLDSLKKSKSENASFLKEENLDRLLQDFITVCDKIKNLNDNLWNLTLNETSKLIGEVAERSKHPFPKLIDILALSGLSILLAQFLKLFE